MTNRLRKAAKNPLIAILPFVALIVVGWAFYARSLNAPSHAQHNLISSDNDSGLPADWSVGGGVDHELLRGDGYQGGKAFGVSANRIEKGSLDLNTAVATVHAGDTYLYKSYHKSSVPFSLLVKYYYEDGSSSLQLAKQYGVSDKWTTNSLAFRADSKTIGAQIQYRLAQEGTLWLDRPYLDRRTKDVYVPPLPGASQKNAIKNSSLTKKDENGPLNWQQTKTGNNAAELSLDHQDGNVYLQTWVTRFKNGAVGWVSDPVASESGQYTQVSVDYRSDATSYLVANYDLGGQNQISVPIATLPPANDWTRVRSYTEAPPKTTHFSTGVMLESKGTLRTDNFEIKNITKPGARHFERPLVSLIFDDGWSSTYATASRIMGFLNYKGTFFISPSSIDQQSFLSEAQIRQLLKDGHQLASGSYEQIDLTVLNTSQLNRQLRLAEGYLKSNLAQSNIDFMPPFEHSDPEVQAVSRKYFHSSISGGEGVNTKQNFDAYNLKAMHIDRSTKSQRIQDALDEAKGTNGWLVLAYDRVEDNSRSKSAVTSKAFTQQMEQVYKSGIPVTTISRALDEEWGQ